MRVNLHGHVSPGFGDYWLNRTGLNKRNVAESVTDICIEGGLTVYTLTGEEFEDKNDRTGRRFNYLFEQARAMERGYELGKLGKVAFVVRRKDDKEVYFLAGQSISVTKQDKPRHQLLENQGRMEILTFGANDIPDGMCLEDTVSFLEDRGLPIIPEHALSIEIGGIGEELLRKYCEDKKFLALEHNAQLTLPKVFRFVPKFKDFTRSANEKIEKIASEYGVPVIASDDSNWPSHIGVAFNEFEEGSIRLSNGELIVQDLMREIKAGNFKAIKGYVPLGDWFNWTIREILVKEKMMGLKKKFERVVGLLAQLGLIS